MTDDGDDRQRNKRGQYVPTVTPERVLAALRDAEDPAMTAKEVGDALGCSSEAARQRLDELRERGAVGTKQVGAGARVGWPAES